jgi:mono/diheme cytochrome c family protein
MYQGILQHRIYVTPYLRQQIESRELDKPIQQGRIYRIAPGNAKGTPKPQLAQQATPDLVKHLSHRNGWWRDTAQRLLVERNDDSAADALRELATTAADSPDVARVHALWTLEGMGKLDEAIIEKALGDPARKVRAAAVRLTEPILKSDGTGGELLRGKVIGAAKEPDVQMQAALTLGLALPNDQAKQALAAIQKGSRSTLARDLAAFSLGTGQKIDKPKAITKAKPLSPEEQKLFAAGKEVYEATCLACHQPHGMGQEGLAPPLVGTDWMASSPERLIRVVLHGLRGPIKVKGQTYEMDMPALGVLDDEQIASVLTYVRREWGHTYSAVKPDLVKTVREATEKREEAWTEAELLKIR